jgi:hypothetical protein
MYCSASTFKGEIFAVGGVEDTKSLTSIERYDPKSGTWIVDQSLPRTMCGCGMQVLDSVPITQIYSSKKRKAPYVDSSTVSTTNGSHDENDVAVELPEAVDEVEDNQL